MSYVALLRYYSFQTHAFDLGIFNQAFFTALHGQLFHETPDQLAVPSGSFLGVHFNLLMFLLLPLYAIYPTSQNLLVMQTIVIALGAVPIYLIAKCVVRRESIALAMALVYLINPSIINLNFYDFHLEAFLPFFLGMFFYFFMVGNWRGYSLFLGLSLITIDFASVLVLGICVAHVLRALGRSGGEEGRRLHLHLDRTRVKVIVLTMVCALVTLFVVLSLTVYFSDRSVTVGGSLSSFLGSYWTWQAFLQKSEFWMLCLIPLMFLPLLAPSQLVMVAPWFAVTVVAAEYATSYSFGYQLAGAFVAPFLIIGSVFAVEKIHRRGLGLRWLFACVIVFSLFISPLNPLAQSRLPGVTYQQGLPTLSPHDQILNEAISLVPSNASILTQNSLFPQVSGRSDAYMFLPAGDTSIQYVLADSTALTYVQGETVNQTMKVLLPYLLSTGRYGIVVNDDGVILLKQGYKGPVVLYGPTSLAYNYQVLSLRSGFEQTDSTSVSGTILVHSASEQNGTFWFGPYVSLPPGQYNVSFVLKTAPTTQGSLYLQVDAFENATSVPILAQARVTQANFTNPGTWQTFTFGFTLSAQQSANGRLEFRGVGVTGGPFSLDYVRVTYVSIYDA